MANLSIYAGMKIIVQYPLSIFKVLVYLFPLIVLSQVFFSPFLSLNSLDHNKLPFYYSYLSFRNKSKSNLLTCGYLVEYLRTKQSMQFISIFYITSLSNI